jgi:hypothetical protein
MKINASWHKENKLKMPSTLALRVKWHEAHLKHCGCRKNLPPTILAEFKNQGKKVCGRGHLYKGKGLCSGCWPGHRKKPARNGHAAGVAGGKEIKL